MLMLENGFKSISIQENARLMQNEVNDKTFLKNRGGYIIDRAMGKEGLTTASLIMFSKVARRMLGMLCLNLKKIAA